MTTRYPPRREPRVLALIPAPYVTRWAVADPWEIRGAGCTRSFNLPRATLLARLVRREHPTVIVVPRASIPRFRAAARMLGVAIVPASFPKLPARIAADLYPEFWLHAPSRPLRQAVLQAASAVLHGQFPPRHYATSRHRPLLRAS